MIPLPHHIPARTVHIRRGERPRKFSYSVDFFLIDPTAPSQVSLFSRNRFNLASIWDKDHGGKRDNGRGVEWAKEQFREAGIEQNQILLLTQPRFLGFGFNPVSFWLALTADAQLVGVIAEVNNTFGDRHSYICHVDGKTISPDHIIQAQKMLHVSPFQEVDGEYSFIFNVLDKYLKINIDLKIPGGGVFANLKGPRHKLSSYRILLMLLRRPFGSVRTIVLIYWQAMLLKFRGETYRVRPSPPKREVS